MGNFFQDRQHSIAFPSRLFKIETVAGHFIVRCKRECRKQPSRRFRPLSGASRIPPSPTYDILFRGVLPNADIQRIDLNNLGDDQLAADGHSIAPANLYAVFYQRHFGLFTSLERPTIPLDAPFPTVDAPETKQVHPLRSYPAGLPPIEDH
jgi:hypothetical protein